MTILEKIAELFEIAADAEITLEANPDDLTTEYLNHVSETPVNRLSIGVQSFFENDLKMMNRRHNAIQAVRCVEEAWNSGFSNISIDLIYGLPGLTNENWNTNLRKAFLLPINHLSAYHLTYHEGTRFFDLLKKGVLREMNEEDSVRQFELLSETAAANNFDQYEISNFAKDGLISKHNTGYWFGEIYLGIGPSAHSFDIKSRQWNVSNLAEYLNFVKTGTGFTGSEILSETDQFNDHIITRLRTKWGIDKAYLGKRFGMDMALVFENSIGPFISSGFVTESEGIYKLNRKGLFISDKIMEALIIAES